ncbi:MAG: glutamine--tRNA ligase/YqeY domain fusion protein [Deltaproteobacteria bacterium]|nr:glutamine--tRNA ligase/YqeY domain fusion protein [Deltaproteobacteria bacterium]MBW2396233.1 glutamine--tRNA ligase/YqeY domain fusion protein [Deltaproteobacteria bacterium]
MVDETPAPPEGFIRQIIREELAAGKIDGVVTRFPPEPNGHLHIGHASAICQNFLVAETFGGRCHLRFDDTNPAAEEAHYADRMMEDIRWLGFDWGEHLHYTSDYFEQIFEFACVLLREGTAFVCDLSSEEIAAHRGTLKEPGTASPYRERSPEENLDLFQRMRAGEFAPGERVVRAKIDMGSSVLPMRDPVLYRIQATAHPRTGTTWPIYPMYDFAHSLSDAIEGITHSLCSHEFVDRRPLYDWILEHVGIPTPRPRQIEFGRVGLTHTVMSKRHLARLIDAGIIPGWDDPRMPTLSGMRRRGYTPESIRNFCTGVGLTRQPKTVDLARLEFEIREHLNEVAPRFMGVQRPLKLIVENYPEDGSEELSAVNNPQDPTAGSREVPFSRELWIEQDDFAEDPPKKFHRLTPGKEVRLRYAYLVTCTDVVKDADGQVVEVHCRYDPETRGGDAPDGRKVRGTIHWVSARHAIPAELRLYDVLFRDEEPDPRDEGFEDALNPDSLKTLDPAWLEPSLAEAPAGTRLQLERLGYFCVDPDSTADRPVLNRIVGLRDTWGKLAKRGKA